MKSYSKTDWITLTLKIPNYQSAPTALDISFLIFKKRPERVSMALLVPVSLGQSQGLGDGMWPLQAEATAVPKASLDFSENATGTLIWGHRQYQRIQQEQFFQRLWLAKNRQRGSGKIQCQWMKFIQMTTYSIAGHSRKVGSGAF